MANLTQAISDVRGFRHNLPLGGILGRPRWHVTPPIKAGEAAPLAGRMPDTYVENVSAEHNLSNLLLRKLQRYVRLSDKDRSELTEALGPTRNFAARADIVEQGDDPRAVNVILDGWAVRYRQFTDGRRQIMALLVPGELCDPQIFLLDRMDHAVGALTPVVLARMPGNVIRSLSASSHTFSDAFHREALASAAIQREWTVSLGRRTAIERVVHLFCEMHARLRAVGLASSTGCPFPSRSWISPTRSARPACT